MRCGLYCYRSMFEYHSRGGMKESGIGRENGLEAFHACMPVSFLRGLPEFRIVFRRFPN